MGNDKYFIQPEDLPFRLIEVSTGSAPYESSQPPHRYNKHSSIYNHKPIEISLIQGYDDPPSILPPPTIPNRYDKPILILPERSDLYKFNSNKILSKSSSIKIHDHHHHHHRRKIRKIKLKCCVIS
ncbi:unnamed protein product [Rotaria sordida]|uniref:Uncharacterized protein n=1 Tax=Rotaria sordida TaxID=392033 RepID=A0A814YXQ4_9BILA|nr:unnamed protein product [Rotaria sordida]CAF3879306.1 unnamed protein product [Rotaria sordida]